MPIAYLTLELRIEAAHSLKDKRQVLRSVKDRLRNSFNISIAEIESTDLWQRATLGVVSISDSRDYLQGLRRNGEKEAVRLANNAGGELVDTFLDYVDGYRPFSRVRAAFACRLLWTFSCRFGGLYRPSGRYKSPQLFSGFLVNIKGHPRLKN